MKNKEIFNKAFNKFNVKITLDNSKRDSLIRGREGLRNRIKSKFLEKSRLQPKFYMQGSFAMKTTVNPCENKEYDVDDGIYIQGFSDKEMNDWPTTKTVHSWIKDAVENYTTIMPIDKNTCVRVTFLNGYHIDLPIYICKNEKIYLAHKEKGWIVSDPKEFTDWFINKVKTYGEQLRSIVKYLKAWKDYNNIDIKGLEVTILVANNFYLNVDNDLNSLLGTVANINNTLKNGFLCIKPVSPYENLFENRTDSQRENILNEFKNLQDKLYEAANEEDIEKIDIILNKIFGNRFPGIEKEKEEKENCVKTNSPAILKNDGHSA